MYDNLNPASILQQKSKKLPIQLPLLKAYKHHALPLAIYESNGNGQEWIFCQYLQLYAKDYREDGHWLDFFIFDAVIFRSYAPWLTVQNITSDLIQSLTSVSTFIKTCIDSNHYVYINYDSFYMSYNEEYNETHNPNNLLIWGYDEQEGTFDVLDYLYTSSEKLEMIKVPMKDIESAFTSGNRWARVMTYHPGYQDRLDLSLITRTLEDYIYSRNSSSTYGLYSTTGHNHIYGISVYDVLIRYCEECEDKDLYLSFLPFCILLEHKALLLALMKHLASKFTAFHFSEITDTYTEIEKSAFILRNLAMKYRIQHRKAILETIRTKLITLKKREYDVLTAALSELHKIMEQPAESYGTGIEG